MNLITETINIYLIEVKGGGGLRDGFRGGLQAKKQQQMQFQHSKKEARKNKKKRKKNKKQKQKKSKSSSSVKSSRIPAVASRCATQVVKRVSRICVPEHT